MPMENSPESLFDIETLLQQFTTALASSSVNLYHAFHHDPDKKDLPYVYHIPEMSISLKMELSYGKEKMKGVFRKSMASETSSLQSTLTLKVVSVPRTGPAGN